MFEIRVYYFTPDYYQSLQSDTEIENLTREQCESLLEKGLAECYSLKGFEQAFNGGYDISDQGSVRFFIYELNV